MNKYTPSSRSSEFQDPLSDFEPIQYETKLKHVLAETTIDQMVATPYVAIQHNTRIRDAVKTMSRRRTAGLLVLDAGKLVGIFTERDVLERVAEQFEKLADRPVSEVMTVEPTVVYDTDPVAAAVAAISVAGHRHVPVLKIDGTLAGVLGPIRVFEFLDPHLDA